MIRGGFLVVCFPRCNAQEMRERNSSVCVDSGDFLVAARRLPLHLLRHCDLQPAASHSARWITQEDPTHLKLNWPPTSVANREVHRAGTVEVEAVIWATLVTGQSTLLFAILILYL